MKEIFYNSSEYSIRAGWRILLFIGIAFLCNLPLAGLIKILTSLFPVLKVNTFAMFVIYIGFSIATRVTLRYVDKRPFESVGLTFKANVVKEFFIGLGMGFGMMTVIYVTEYVCGWVVIEFRALAFTDIISIGAYSLATYIVVGYGEELLFRGYILQSLIEGTNKYIAVGVFSIVFGFAHAGNDNVTPFAIANIVLAGIWLAVAYLKTGALWLPIGLHISWNFTQGFIYGYPVSGTTSEKEQIALANVSGPEWLTGGPFGPEGGAIATVILLIGILFILRASFINASPRLWSLAEWKSLRANEITASVSGQTEVNS